MSNQIGWNITMQQIHIFLQAMEMRNFTKVASALNFTPSMVSKTIIAMENELGIDLFIRKPHELSPTPAACLLADEWRQLIGSYDNAIDKVRRFQKENYNRIVLGFVDSSVKMDQKIKSIILRYQNQVPEIRILPEKHDMHRSVELVNFGMLDLALTNEIEIPYIREHDLAYDIIRKTKVTAYVPEGNPLFARNSISFKDLQGQSFLALDAKMHPGYNNWLFALCNTNGFVPRIENSYRTVRSLMFSLDLQNSIFIGDSITVDWENANLKAFDLPEDSSLIMVYRKDASQKILEFRKYMKKEFQNENS